MPTTLQLTADREQISVRPGARAEILLRVVNTGSSEYSMHLVTEGIPASWTAIAPLSARLPVGGQTQASLALTPPPDAPPGVYSVTCRAEAIEASDVSTEVALIVEIGAGADLRVELGPPQAQRPDMAQYTVTVTHDAATPADVTLAARDGGGGADYTFEPVRATVLPGQPATSRLTVRGRSSTSVGLEVIFRVLATTGDGLMTGQATGRFSYMPALPIQVMLDPPYGDGPDGARYTVQLTNPNANLGSFQLTASDAAQALDYRFEPQTVAVSPQGVGRSTLVVSPRQYHTDPLDKLHHFTVVATAVDGSLAEGRTAGQYTQHPVPRIGLSLQPSSQTARGEAHYILQVTNPRAAPLEVTLVPHESQQAGFEFLDIKPERLRLGPNATAEARLRARGRLERNETSRIFPFVIEARPADATAASPIEGTLIQERRSFPVALALIPLLLLLAACIALGGWQLFSSRASSPEPTPAATARLVVLPSAVPALPPSPPTARPSTTAAPPTAISDATFSNFMVCAQPCTGTNAARTFPAGTQQLYAQWSFEGMRPGAKYVRRWTIKSADTVFVQYECTWPGPADGETRVRLFPVSGPLPSGTWEATITLDGKEVMREQLQIQGTVPPSTANPVIRSSCTDAEQ